MANQKVEKQLDGLKLLRDAGRSDTGIAELRKALHDKVNAVVAKAADVVRTWQAAELIPDLLSTFSVLIEKPERDPQCLAKIAIAKALSDLGHSESAVFVRGLYCKQLESTWGGKVDTAATLRATCAHALVPCTDMPRHEKLLHFVNAVSEAEAPVRTDAVRALEQMGGRDVELLLRLKARAGDSEVRVTGQVFESVLQLEGEGSIAFVADFLKNAERETSEEAAIALGASRLEPAVALLIDEWTTAGIKHNGAVLFRAISASRLDSALDFLLEQVRSARLPVACDALSALALHKDSEEIVKRIEVAVTRSELQPMFLRHFRS